MKKTKLAFNIVVILAAIAVITLYTPLALGNFGNNKELQESLGTVLYLIFGLKFAVNIAISFIDSTPKAKSVSNVVACVLAGITVFNAFVLFLTQFSHEAFHRLEMFIYFSWGCIYFMPFIAIIFSLVEIIIMIVKKYKKQKLAKQEQ